MSSVSTLGVSQRVPVRARLLALRLPSKEQDQTCVAIGIREGFVVFAPYAPRS